VVNIKIAGYLSQGQALNTTLINHAPSQVRFIRFCPLVLEWSHYRSRVQVAGTSTIDS